MPSAFRRNLLHALWFLFAFAALLALLDGIQMVSARGGAATAEVLRAVFAGAGVMLLCALTLALVVAPAIALLCGERTAGDLLRRAWRAVIDGLRAGPVAARAGIQAALLATPLMLGAWALATAKAGVWAHDAVVRAENAGLAAIVLQGAILVVVVVGWFVLRAALRALLTLAGRARPLALWVSRPWVTLAVILAGAAAAATLFALRKAAVLSALDLRPVWMLAAALALALGLTWGRTRLPLGPQARRYSTFGLLGAALLLAVVSMVGLDYGRQARSLLLTHTTFARHGQKLLTSFTDFDGDGHSAFFAGGDCEPGNPKVYPGALDVPYNGIDEDCSGADLRFDKPTFTPRWDHPVPDTVPQRPAIVFITVDSFNPRHLSGSGYRRPLTPNIDALARRSRSFVNACAQGPSTRLSLPALLTSRYDPQVRRAPLGAIPLELLPDNQMMAEILRGGGYRTVGVLPTGYFKGWRGLMQGFDRVDRSAFEGRKDVHSSQFVTDAAIKQLEEAKKDKRPVFLWVHYYDPHHPFKQPKGAPTYGSAEVDRYDAELQFTDRHLGRLISWIDSNMPQNGRLIVLTGDHGETFDARHPSKHHGYDLHTFVLRVPLFFQAAWVPPGKVRQAASLMDLLPTFVNLARIKGKYSFEGTSLVPPLLLGKEELDRMTFHTFYLPEYVKKSQDPMWHAAVRTDRYNLILNRKDGVVALYDFQSDPEETNDIYDEQPELAASLRNQLEGWVWRMENERARLNPYPDAAAAPAQKPGSAPGSKPPANAGAPTPAAKSAGAPPVKAPPPGAVPARRDGAAPPLAEPPWRSAPATPLNAPAPTGALTPAKAPPLAKPGAAGATHAPAAGRLPPGSASRPGPH